MKDEDLKAMSQSKNGKFKVVMFLFWPCILLLLFVGVMLVKGAGEVNAKRSAENLAKVQTSMVFKGNLPWTNDEYGKLIALIRCPGDEPIFLNGPKKYKASELFGCKYYLAKGVQVIEKITKNNPEGIISFEINE